MSDWRPEGVKRWSRKRPAVGAVVAYDYRAWEVRHVRATEPSGRGYDVTLRRLHGARHEWENSACDIGLGISEHAYDPLPAYPNGRVPLCSCCNHPWPCLEADQQALAAKELKAAERELRLMPGCCPACEEPVTSRQRSVTFGGPNVNNPLAEGPTFHLRRKCYGSAARYEEAWVTAEPGRRRSLLTLKCSGGVIVHHDGTAECFGAEDSDCPSVYAHHRYYSACYLLSHGCGRGCSRAGHPGTHIAGRPSDPRAVTQETP